MPRSPSPLPIALAAAIAAAPAVAPAVTAQSAPPDTAGAVCLGFSFGAWSPPLDWRAAGHGRMPDTSAAETAPAGRDWAADGIGGTEDSLVLLFPRWWPVGIAVTLPTRRPAPGDTIVGRAQALVADMRTRNPTSRVRAWRVACGVSR